MTHLVITVPGHLAQTWVWNGHFWVGPGGVQVTNVVLQVVPYKRLTPSKDPAVNSAIPIASGPGVVVAGSSSVVVEWFRRSLLSITNYLDGHAVAGAPAARPQLDHPRATGKQGGHVMSHAATAERGARGVVRRPMPSMKRHYRLPIAWPLATLLLGYPLWWTLGLAPLAWTIFVPPDDRAAGPQRRPVKLPPMFWVWGLFLALVIISGLMMDVNAPETVPVNSGLGHYVAYAIRLISYLSVTRRHGLRRQPD